MKKAIIALVTGIIAVAAVIGIIKVKDHKKNN